MTRQRAMQTYDIIMLTVLVGATVFGAWKGLAWQLASLGAIIASYFVAINFRGQLAGHLPAEPPWNTFIAMLVLYVGTSLVIWIVFRVVKRNIDRLKLKEFDRQIGALFGFAKGVLLCVIITLFAMTLSSDIQRRAIVHSHSGYYIARLLDKSHAVMPGELHDVLHPYIHSLDARLDEPPHSHGPDGHDHAHDAPDAPDRVSPLDDVDVELIPLDELRELLNARDRSGSEEGPVRR